MPGEYTSRFVTAQDGLRLHVRDYKAPASDNLPVVCLPGLARTGADFHELGLALSRDADAPRRVIALDYRGRGRSDYDRNPANYSFATEVSDLLAVLTAFEIARAVFVGTSRGGLLIMLLATVRPAAIAGAVLNDIGPVIDPRGLVRIKSYVGKLPQPANFDDAAELLRRLFSGHFPKLTAAEWMAFARRSFEERGGRLVPTYDPRLAKTLETFDIERPLPPLWKEFDALCRIPMMVIRGANSDVLSPETVSAMRQRRRELEVFEVPDQGHAPLLAETGIVNRLAAFVARCEPFSATRKLPGKARSADAVS
jgi:pimeloyl-ACP methyl ester carboxylesterase